MKENFITINYNTRRDSEENLIEQIKDVAEAGYKKMRIDTLCCIKCAEKVIRFTEDIARQYPNTEIEIHFMFGADALKICQK